MCGKINLLLISLFEYISPFLIVLNLAPFDLRDVCLTHANFCYINELGDLEEGMSKLSYKLMVEKIGKLALSS